MGRTFNLNDHQLARIKRPDPYPLHTLDRVDRPTTKIDAELVRRVDERAGGFFRAKMGAFGEKIKNEYPRFVPKYPLSGSLVSMCGALGQMVDADGMCYDAADTPWGVSSWTPMQPAAEKKAPGTHDPAFMSRHIKEAAYFLRADMVGICRLPAYAVFSHGKHDGKEIVLEHKYAIAILVDQDWPTSKATNGHDWISNSMSFLAYATSGFIACVLADYIRRLGYRSRAHHAMNYQVVVPPILLWAGLGEMCRAGDIVLNPFLGARFKAAVVTTDLPLKVDRPIDFGLQDFCNKCGKCAEKCPSKSITYGGKVVFNGYERWPLDVEKCTSMRVGNQRGSGCGTCIKVCPWNKPFTPFHRAVGWIMRKVPVLRKPGVWLDDLFGYGRPTYRDKWWLDLENVRGELKTAEKADRG